MVVNFNQVDVDKVVEGIGIKLSSRVHNRSVKPPGEDHPEDFQAVEQPPSLPLVPVIVE
jgi:hypothetical protein